MKKAALLASVAGLLLSMPAAKAAEYTVAIIQSMSGALAFVGVPLVDGMKLAAEEINAKQELGPGNTLKLIIEDDETNRAQAVSLVKRHAADPKVLAIMGPTTTAVAIAGAQAANEDKIVALVTTNSPEIAKTGPYGFRLSQPPEVLMEAIGKYSVEKLGIKECVLIGVLDNAAYVEQTQAYQDYVTSKGVKILAREGIKQGDTDFSALSAKVASMNPECVFMSAIAPTAANLIIQLKQAGLPAKTKLVGMSSMTSAALFEVGGAAVEGLYLVGDWVPGGGSEQGKAFAAAYKKRFGTEPDNWGPMGYGGLRVMAEAIRKSLPDPTRDKIRDNLAQIKDYPTLFGGGKFTYDAQRAPRYGTNILVVKNGQFVLAPN
jgi:branched-chain amino acid transport system substrate-binding protein